MTKFLYTLLCLLALPVYAQQTQYLKSEIKRVKLYLTSGELTHEQEIKLQKGRNKIVFTGISAFADQRSIQFNSNGSARTVSLSTEMDFLAAEEFNPKIGELKDSLMVLKDRLQLTYDQISAYNAEQAVLNTNRDIKGNESLTAEKIKAVADFYRNRTLEISKAMSRLNKEKEQLNIRIEETRLQLTEFNFIENQRSNQVIVLLDCDKAETINGILKYQVSDCGWAPTYDLSVLDINQPINLKYKAQIYNNTGNEWKNVDLVLSTSDPSLSAAAPILNPFFITYNDYMSDKRQKYVQPAKYEVQQRTEVMNEINMANQRAYDNYYLDEEKTSVSGRINDVKTLEVKQVATVQMKTLELSELNAEFPIQHTFSCPSDARPYLVEIKDLTLPASFAHISVPKLDQGAFLLAKIVGWQDLDLIAGPTNVYFAGNYVGMSQIDTRNVADTLELSFGRDSKIQVLRKLKADKSLKKTTSSTKRDSYFYDISIRNNRSVPITIDVFDQIPMSRSTDITVSIETLGGGEHNVETGEVTYKVTILPGETKSFELGYTVKYPKNQSINVRTFKTISAPSF